MGWTDDEILAKSVRCYGERFKAALERNAVLKIGTYARIRKRTLN